MAEQGINDAIRGRLYRAAELAMEDDPSDEQLRDIVFFATDALVELGKTPRGKAATDHVRDEIRAVQEQRRAERAAAGEGRSGG